MRDRRTVFVLGAAALTCLVVAIFVLRDQFIESWWIWKLESKDISTRVGAAQTLGERGGDRAVGALIKDLEASPWLGNSAVRALARIHPRAGPKAKVNIIQCLLQVLPLSEPAEPHFARPGIKAPPSVRPKSPDLEPLHDREVVQSLCGLKVDQDAEIEVLLSALGDNGEVKRAALAAILFNWDRAEKKVARHLSSIEPEDVSKFFHGIQALCERSGWPFWWAEKPGIWPGTTVQKAGNDLAAECEKPETRAIALSFGIFGIGLDGEPYSETRALNALAHKDRSPLVRKAAIRMAGFLGPIKGNVDLSVSDLLFEEKDPALLTEVIEARSFQASPSAISSPDSFAVMKYSQPGLRLELWDGFLCSWLKQSTTPLPWIDRELARLRDVLDRETDPALRDSASHALVVHDRALETLPHLRVHEWGVFRDEGSISAPAEKWLEDVPRFVVRSQVSCVELWSSRYYRPSPSLKPVIFFYSPEPARILLRVGFFRGRPWSFFPEATDYITTSHQIPWRLPTEVRKGGAPPPLEDGEGISPPWISLDANEGEPPSPTSNFHLLDTPPRGELRSRFALVPWVTPNHSTVEYELAGFGLEWCGLRIGYPDRLERELPAIDDASWWNHLRKVPSTTVALRGGQEKFLFYDGSVRLPSPILAAWANKDRTALSLRLRDLRSYPPPWNSGPPPQMHPPAEGLPGALVIIKNPAEEARGRFLDRLSLKGAPITVDLARLPLDGNGLWSCLKDASIGQGLTEPEAEALLATWKGEFFETPGIRLITLLPRWIYDAVLPLSIQPAPGDIVRVGLSWKECDDLEEFASPAMEGPEKIVESSAETPVTYSWTSGASALPKKPIPRGTRLPSFTMDPASGELKGLPGGLYGAVLTGDGSMVICDCRSDDSKITTLYLADLKTQSYVAAVRIPEDEGALADFVASDDGLRIAVLTELKESWGLEMIDFERGERVEVLRATDLVQWLSMSGDGKKIAFRQGSEIVWVDMEDRAVSRLKGPDGSTGQFLTLSRDGSFLFFIAAAASPEKERELHRADLSKRSVASLGPWDGGALYPGISADGTRALVSRARGFGSPVACLLDLRTGSLRPMVKHGTDHSRMPMLSPDGAKVFYSEDEELWSMEVDTGQKHRCLSSDRFSQEHFNYWIDPAGHKALQSDGPSIFRSDGPSIFILPFE